MLALLGGLGRRRTGCVAARVIGRFGGQLQLGRRQWWRRWRRGRGAVVGRGGGGFAGRGWPRQGPGGKQQEGAQAAEKTFRHRTDPV